MSGQYVNEPMLDLFIYETVQLVEQLEQIILTNEKSNFYPIDAINEIFRIMHTIKGSSAMMLFNNISTLAHALEDLFFCLREDKPQKVDYSQLSDLVLDGLDFIKVEIAKIKNGDEVNGDATNLINNVKDLLADIKTEKHSTPSAPSESFMQTKQQYYISKVKADPEVQSNSFQATLRFEDGSGMENLRAFGVINDLTGVAEEIRYIPEDLDSEDSAEAIIEQGFAIYIKTSRSFEEIHQLLSQTVFLKDLQLDQVDNQELSERIYQEDGLLNVKSSEQILMPKKQGRSEKLQQDKENDQKELNSLTQQSIISVSVAKLDQLMDLVGEMVIAEAMVTQNPDLKGLDIKNFEKAARQLRKITGDLQDIVMSVRMVPLSGTFQKMNRPLRDMCKKLNKEVRLQLMGEETEVDKNIIEHISDPLMHLIRNSIDHGIETPEQRVAAGKPREGTITLEAKNAGGDVLIIVRDNGQGFSKDKILAKAGERGLLTRPENELTDKEIYNMVFLPGFSTKEQVTEFSGRGVGMDVVVKNIEAVGGSISADSIQGQGTILTLKIPLTLAIIDGMNIKVGDSHYTIPLIAIKESFKPRLDDIVEDPDHNEMIMVRGQCYPILRLHEIYRVQTKVTDFIDGIMVMIEQDNKTLCIFADELLGQQQVVVKALPAYIKNIKKVKGLAGCTLLGDGSISLILDIIGLIN